MPARGHAGPMVPLQIKVPPELKDRYDRERIKRNLSQREFLEWLMASSGIAVPMRKKRRD